MAGGSMIFTTQDPSRDPSVIWRKHPALLAQFRNHEIRGRYRDTQYSLLTPRHMTHDTSNVDIVMLPFNEAKQISKYKEYRPIYLF